MKINNYSIICDSTYNIWNSSYLKLYVYFFIIFYKRNEWVSLENDRDRRHGQQYWHEKERERELEKKRDYWYVDVPNHKIPEI